MAMEGTYSSQRRYNEIIWYNTVPSFSVYTSSSHSSRKSTAIEEIYICKPNYILTISTLALSNTLWPTIASLFFSSSVNVGG